MHSVTLQKTIPYWDVRVVAASDPQHRSFIGMATGGEDRAVLFIQVDRVTVLELELERGEVDLYTVMSDRCVGLVFEAEPDGSGLAPLQFQIVRKLTNAEPI